MIHWRFITCIQFPKRVWSNEAFWKIGWKKERSVQAQPLIHTHTHAHTRPVTPHPHPHNQNTYTTPKHQHLIHSLQKYSPPINTQLNDTRTQTDAPSTHDCLHLWTNGMIQSGRVWASLTLLTKRTFLLEFSSISSICDICKSNLRWKVV